MQRSEPKYDVWLGEYMWQNYIGKTILVKELDDERGFGDNPITMIVLKTMQANLQEMAFVSSTRGDTYWTYCSRYIVLTEEDSSELNASWNEHIGKSLLVDDGSGIILEVIPLQARGIYCLGKFKWIDRNDESCRWFNTSEYSIVNNIL